MNPSPRNPFAPGTLSAYGPGSIESTLRLIANLPSPKGLEDRVQAALLAAPMAVQPSARILAWPAAFRPQAGWMRAAAAAAIVFVVAGGGWGIYSRVQPVQPVGARAVPTRIAAPAAGFSSAGAMRTPQTLNGPVAPKPAVAPKAAATLKSPAKAGEMAAHRGRPAEKKKASALPASDPAK